MEQIKVIVLVHERLNHTFVTCAFTVISLQFDEAITTLKVLRPCKVQKDLLFCLDTSGRLYVVCMTTFLVFAVWEEVQYCIE